MDLDAIAVLWNAEDNRCLMRKLNTFYICALDTGAIEAATN